MARHDKIAVIGLSKVNSLPRFRREQELEQGAQVAIIRRAGVQALEACSIGQAITVQTGSACEDREAEGE